MSDVQTPSRAQTLGQLAADIHMLGLPEPMDVKFSIRTPLTVLDLRMDDDSPDAVDAWAKHLNLGEPVEKQIGEGDKAFISRKGEVCLHEGSHWMGWQWVQVWSAIHQAVTP